MSISELVKFEADDGLELDGFAAKSSQPIVTIIHVHGKCGNFYQNKFIHWMANIFPSLDINFLAFNNRGHDCLAEAYRENKLLYSGGSNERFEDCLSDISGAIAFARNWGAPLILQGHSNGCEKVLYFLASASTRDLVGAVLLSPADSQHLQEQYISPKTLAEQSAALAQSDLESPQLLFSQYGIRRPPKIYDIPVTARSLSSLLSGAGFKMVRYSEKPPRLSGAPPGFVYLGGSDPYITATSDVIRRYYKAAFRSLEFLFLPDGDHHFSGKEETVIRRVADWASSLKPLAA
jgi:hypothetical protein